VGSRCALGGVCIFSWPRLSATLWSDSSFEQSQRETRERKGCFEEIETYESCNRRIGAVFGENLKKRENATVAGRRFVFHRLGGRGRYDRGFAAWGQGWRRISSLRTIAPKKHIQRNHFRSTYYRITLYGCASLSFVF